MKTLLNYFFLLAFMIMLSACDKMDDNYAEYLEKEIIYSPKVSNLQAVAGLREVSLTWDNPEGNVAQGIFVDYQDSTFSTDSLIDSVFISSLEIKGYDISVYTIDKFNNLSVPEIITVFPNGE